MDKYEEKIDEICKIYGVKKIHLLSRRRDNNLIEAKKTAYLVLRNCGLSYPQIGKIMNKDHSTVLKVLKKLK